ncbi:DUF2625 family protein [Antribacter gilvus]|uniref:DUF2625 family protein n=1 Tax=Antribacter gilvus TaxID=2304675 RepID=UPI000F7B05D6|nr:DUF2625 family protein [Antribacter gilvus]
MRAYENLIATQNPAWPELAQRVEQAGTSVLLFEPADATARRTLEQLQVSTGSFLGAVVVHTGGVLIDHGWLRVYGSPAPGEGSGMPSLADVNGFPEAVEDSWFPEYGLVVAHDVLGGTYVLNGHDPSAVGRPGERGEMTYLAPDTLQWEALGAGYAAWLTWALEGGLGEFTSGLRWDGWESEVESIHGDQGLNFFPPLWSKEAHGDLAATSRHEVPMREIVGMAWETAAQIDGVDLGPLGSFATQ